MRLIHLLVSFYFDVVHVECMTRTFHSDDPVNIVIDHFNYKQEKIQRAKGTADSFS